MTSPRDTRRERFLSPGLSQTSRGQRGKRERLGTRLIVCYNIIVIVMFQPNVWNIFSCPSTTVEIWQALRKKQSRWPFFILRTHYPSGRTWANLCSLSSCVSSRKTGTRRIMRPPELPFVVCRSRRISKESSSTLYTVWLTITCRRFRVFINRQPSKKATVGDDPKDGDFPNVFENNIRIFKELWRRKN